MGDLRRCITTDGKVRWFSSVAFDRSVTFGRLRVRATMRNGDGFMGRLGGGWLWKLGILAGRGEIVLELFVMSLRVQWLDAREATP